MAAAPPPEPVPDPPPGPVPPGPVPPGSPPMRDRFNGAVGVLASVLGVLSFIVQPIEYLEGGETDVLALWVLVAAFTVSTVGTVLVTRIAASGGPGGWPVRVAQIVAPVTLGVTLGLAVPLVLRPPGPATEGPSPYTTAAVEDVAADAADGCTEPFVPLHRYSLPRGPGAPLHDIAVSSPGPQWRRGELIGCIRPFG